MQSEEHKRLQEIRAGVPWKRWGTYLSERQWGTVREDYSPHGSAWDFFPHDHARSRVYRWGEDGLAGFCDENQYACFSLALWNGKDSILKERLFGLTGLEGNRNEDVKELYYYTANTPTHSYAEYVYLYPLLEYPYAALVAENARRSHLEPEFELYDTEIFRQRAFAEITVTYFKINPLEWVMKVQAKNVHRRPALLHVLPQITCRNTWSWGYDAYKPQLSVAGATTIKLDDTRLGTYYFKAWDDSELLFTDNESNATRLYGLDSLSDYVKDGFHEYIVRKRKEAVNPKQIGTKAAHHLVWKMEPGAVRTAYFTCTLQPTDYSMEALRQLEAQRKQEMDDFYLTIVPSEKYREVAKQAFSGLLWSKQLYILDMERWLDGDPGQFPPPAERKLGRNHTWRHLKNHDIILMPDKWEYPWYAAWDTVFHALAAAPVDADLAKEQIELFLRKNYMAVDGRIPAYEWAFGDVNPPVSAWGAIQLHHYLLKDRTPDYDFLYRIFRPLSLNFQWWLHTQRIHGRYVFGGGFMGLDNVSIIDRGAPLPTGFALAQADTTAWMAMFALSMAEIALILADTDTYAHLKTEMEKESLYFLEQFFCIADAMHHEDLGLWSEADQWYFDSICSYFERTFLPVYNASTYLCLGAVTDISHTLIQKHENVYQFLREKLVSHSDHLLFEQHTWYISLVPVAKMLKMCDVLFDEQQFLSQYGLRSLSKIHTTPLEVELFGHTHTLRYAPGNSETEHFGENSNWRGPVWFPVNHVVLCGLEVWSSYFGDAAIFKYPSGAEGHAMTLASCVRAIKNRLCALFESPNPALYVAPSQTPFAYPLVSDKNPLLFYEYFHGDTGAGCGASHQTGWTSLVALYA